MKGIALNYEKERKMNIWAKIMEFLGSSKGKFSNLLRLITLQYLKKLIFYKMAVLHKSHNFKRILKKKE